MRKGLRGYAVGKQQGAKYLPLAPCYLNSVPDTFIPPPLTVGMVLYLPLLGQGKPYGKFLCFPGGKIDVLIREAHG